MRIYLAACILFCLLANIGAHSQQHDDSILRRVILIGDAGEINGAQQAVIGDAASRIINDKTTVLFLGNNIYKHGMALSDSNEQIENGQTLRSQFQPMRDKGASVYFLPGNYDWDKSGKQGLAHIQKQWEFLNEQNDSLLKLIPTKGCPDPVEINVSDELTIIAFDSEWWLFPFTKTTPGGDCECTSREDVIERMEELVYKNRFKWILLASHHPFQSYGIKGGYFSWKDHLFPLTAVNKNLYLPLPIIGTIATVARKSFVGPEYLHHPLYRDMIRKVDHVFDSIPNLALLAGHEKGLQLIKGKQLQIVSGAGAEGTSAYKRTNSLFAAAVAGYVTVDVLVSKEVRFSYYVYKDKSLQPVYSYVQPYYDVKSKEEHTYTAITTDSIDASAYAPYDRVSSFHRTFFGESYRKEWAATERLPVFRISELKGGLTPEKRGGGHQTLSLRLKDKNGKEWVIRSIEKYPDVLLPEQLRETFAKDVVRDAMVAQHPYAPLLVPVLANATHVPHANPIIGFVAPDKQLGNYQNIFVNKVCLLEEREPLGNTDNTGKMLDALNQDNDNSVDSISFFRARLLDLFLADWDRHEDQWRWFDTKKGSEKKYLAIPRDRDQALYRSEGFFPHVASQQAIAPFLRGFKPTFKRSNSFFINGSRLDNRFLNQMDHEQWMKITREFTTELSDSVLELAMKKLPRSSYALRSQELLDIMKKRRDNLADASEKYFFFLNKIADIRVSDKNELIKIIDGPNGGMLVMVNKLSKDGRTREQLFSKNYLPSYTKEIRIFTGKGNDSIYVDSKASIKLRIVGGDGAKTYDVVNSAKKIQVYEKESNARFHGKTDKLHKHLSSDSLNTAIVATNRYNLTVPLLVAGLNPDDGFLLGVSVRHTQQGFRKNPGSIQQVNFLHSFSTKAYRVSYKGEWLGYGGKPDFTLQAVVRAPDNTQNFFGRGNETVFIKAGDYKKFYRARFTIYQAEPAFRWKNNQNSSISIGPSYQYYKYDPDDNEGRLTSYPSLIGSYDSNTIANSKSHLGLVMVYNNDKRNSKILTTWGYYVNVRLQAYKGLNSYSESFVQLVPEVAFYKPLNDNRTLVLAERLGGGISLGKTTFYQSLFIGGHENLEGYRQYRFAGQHSLYNNLELRIKLSDFANYIVPGQFGLTTFFDIGRVWEPPDDSHQWHTGVGGGFYFSPAQLVVLQITAGYSKEGWYPRFSMGFRF